MVELQATNDKKDRVEAGPLVEVSQVITLVLIAEWAVLPFFGKSFLIGLIPVCAAFIIMIRSHRIRRESPRDLGWRLDNLGQALALLVPLMAAALLLLIAIGWFNESLRLGRVRLGWPAIETLFWLFVWGLIQEYPLQGFINRRIQMVYGPGPRSVLVVALIFAMLHLPNLWLTVATFFGGVLWSAVYQRVPNLFAAALSHSLMSVALVSTVPYSALHGLRVGYNYFR
jgi:membrane protease YdiL (CAAX protease family)